MVLKDLQDEILKKWDDVPAASLSIDILSFLADLPESELKVLTFRTLAGAAGRKPFDADLLAAINILSGSLSLLDAHAFFVDENDKEYELDDEEFAEARRSGEIVHPVSGELIPEAANYIVPFFVPTDRFFKAVK